MQEPQDSVSNQPKCSPADHTPIEGPPPSDAAIFNVLQDADMFFQSAQVRRERRRERKLKRDAASARSKPLSSPK
jgi:hypothetical protein